MAEAVRDPPGAADEVAASLEPPPQQTPARRDSPAEPATGAPAGPGSARREGDGVTHEALLVRHGLISHVAELSTGVSPVDAGAFRGVASRVAKNVIPLSESRFGLLLTGGVPDELSALAQALYAVGPGHGERRERSESPSLGESVECRRADGPDQAVGRADPATSPEASVPPEIEARLAGIEARIADFTVDAVSARLEARLEHVLTQRLEALLAATFDSDKAPVPTSSDDLSASRRVEDFWAGMEQALRLLHDTAGRLEQATEAHEAEPAEDAMSVEASGRASAPRDIDGSAIAAALAGLEDAVSLGLEAADTARESHSRALEGRLAGLEDRLSKIGHTVASQIAELDRRVSAGLSPDILRAELGDGLAPFARDMAHSRESLREIAEMLAAALGQVDRRLEEAAMRLDGFAETLRAGQDNGKAVADMAERIDALSESLGQRGGVLSDALETSKRSMKNFWLASEDVLRRIDETLSRLEAVDPPGPPERAQGLSEDAERKFEAVAAGLSDAAASLSDLQERQGALDHGARQLRRALAELLARDLRDHGAPPREDAIAGAGAFLAQTGPVDCR